MSLQFYNSSVYGYLRGSPPLSARPYTYHAWVKANDNGAFMTAVQIGNWGNTSDGYSTLGVAGDYDLIAAQIDSMNEGYSGSATATDSFDSYFGVWTPITAHFPASAGAYASIAGGTDSSPVTGNYEALSSPDAIAIGAGMSGSGNFDGRISIVSIWNICLSDAQEEELNTKLPSEVSFYDNCVAWYDFRTNDGNILKNKKNPGTYDLTAYGSTTPQYYADDPTFALKYLKLLVDPAAQGDGSVTGWVIDADDVTYYGKFTGAAFESSLDGNGNAVLLVPVTEFGGEALTTSDTPRVVVRTTNDGTTMCDAEIVEQ